MLHIKCNCCYKDIFEFSDFYFKEGEKKGIYCPYCYLYGNVWDNKGRFNYVDHLNESTYDKLIKDGII